MVAAPGFVTSHPAPAEWQERVQAVDRDLWIAWNVHHPGGPRWCIVRWHGRPRVRGVVLLEKEDLDGEFLKACCHGWSVVGHLETPDGVPCGLTDAMVAALVRADMRKKYGTDRREAEEKMIAEHKEGEAQRQAEHDKLMADAFHDMQNDHTATRNATSGLVTTGGDG